MLLIVGDCLSAPSDAERLFTSLWQLTAYRSRTALGLYVLAIDGGDPILGVSSEDSVLERLAAEKVAGALNGNISEGGMVAGIVASEPSIAAVRMFPKGRDFHLESWRLWGSQKVDPLKMVYGDLERCPPGHTAGVAMVIRALPNAVCLTRLTTFAAGDLAAEMAVQLSSSYAGVGVTLHRPYFGMRKAVAQCLTPALGWPWARVRTDVASVFWHPRYDPKATPAEMGRSAA